ncbi:DUF4184 family protein [Viridibacillus sp. NPDC093762]|uniref:DUF4184 family protein n=1 Tax=Viridibacillus sp. NPDC093762 TaxID=3390720 RepID=UPI003CFF9621
MPLTFAHPAAVLPFYRNNKYINFSAMVIGSMAPDFEYFLRGRPYGDIGHTLLGFFYFNLPLALVVYLVYHLFIHQTFSTHLPKFLQGFHTRNIVTDYKFKPIVWIYSTLFGMLTHVLWDSFTHISGFMVARIPLLTNSINFNGFSFPIFKVIQHTSTLFGLILISGLFIIKSYLNKSDLIVLISVRHKLSYWTLIFISTLALFLMWNILNNVSFKNYGTLVVRVIDSSFLSLLIVSIYFKYRK